MGSAKSQETIFKVALPVSLEAVFQTSLGFVDQIIVGTLGATAVAAVGLCNSISFHRDASFIRPLEQEPEF